MSKVSLRDGNEIVMAKQANEQARARELPEGGLGRDRRQSGVSSSSDVFCNVTLEIFSLFRTCFVLLFVCVFYLVSWLSRKGSLAMLENASQLYVFPNSHIT